MQHSHMQMHHQTTRKGNGPHYPVDHNMNNCIRREAHIKHQAVCCQGSAPTVLCCGSTRTYRGTNRPQIDASISPPHLMTYNTDNQPTHPPEGEATSSIKQSVVNTVPPLALCCGSSTSHCRPLCHQQRGLSPGCSSTACTTAHASFLLLE